MDTPALTVRDIAKFLSVDEKIAYRLVKYEDLPEFMDADSWRFNFDDIDVWIENQKAALR